jgi:MFS family permease
MGRIPNHVEALLAALRFRDSSSDKLNELQESQWQELLSFCDSMHMTLPVGEVCGGILPAWVRSRIEHNLADNSRRFLRIKGVYSEVAGALREANLEFLVINGFAQSPDYVENPRMRVQPGIDLFCPIETVYRARDVVARFGYRPESGLNRAPSHRLAVMNRESSYQWRGNFFDPEIPVGVKLHFHFWDETSTRFRPPGLEAFWPRRVGRQLEEISFLGLAPADNLGYSSLRLLKDLLRGEWTLDQVYEIAHFLHMSAENDSFWQNWQDLHDPTLRSLEAISFRIARNWFACDTSEQVTAEIKQLKPSIQQWFRHFSHSPLSATFRLNKDALWLHMSLLESRRAQAAVLCKKLLPSRIAVERKTTRAGRSTEVFCSQRDARVELEDGWPKFHQVRVLPSTLWHGLRWWWAGKGLDERFWTFFGAAFCFDFGEYIFFLLYNLYMVDRGASEKLLGWVTGSVALGSLAGTIPAGFLAQRYGLRRSLLLCLAAVPLLSALRTIFVSEAPQLALAFLTGAAMSIWAVCISPTLAQLTDENNRPFAFSLVFSSGIGIGILAGLFGGVLPSWLGNIMHTPTSAHVLQFALLISCVLVALGLFPAARLKLPVMPTQEKKFYPRGRFLPRFLLAIGLWSLVTTSLAPFSNIYFSRYLHMSVLHIGMVFSVAQISQVFAILLAPLIYKRFGLVPGIMYTQLAAALCMGCLAAVPIASAAAVLYTGYAGLQWMSEPGMYSLLMSEVSVSERSGASALNFFVVSLASVIAAAVAGQGFARFGYPKVIGFTAAFAVVAAIAFRVLLSNSATAPLAHPNKAASIPSEPTRLDRTELPGT